MVSRVKVLGHPVHPMIIPFPVGLLATSLVFDIAHVVSDNGRWADIAYWMLIAGIVGGALAAPFGAIDWRAIPGATRAKTIGRWHGLGNALALVLFVASWAL